MGGVWRYGRGKILVKHKTEALGSVVFFLYVDEPQRQKCAAMSEIVPWAMCVRRRVR